MDSEVCDDETNNWRACVEDNLSAPDLDRKCSENEGEPPPQCAAMSCLIGACLRKNGYSFERCKLPMHYFKHCVKSFYGSEYVT
uniref:CHCH domain-containing protein n=1 Tax=Glossina morsitans morsitans TaxID=37546 RepID=D3TR31_GLOMM